jgi:predicted nucleic acid-binding protein
MLVDTNVLSELMRPTPQSRVVAWAKRQDGFSVSVVSLEEILFGLALKPNLRVEQWFAGFLAEHCEVLTVTERIARRCAVLRAGHRARGRQRTQADMLVAATAGEHAVPLATRNVRDFDGCGISVVNPFRF